MVKEVVIVLERNQMDWLDKLISDIRAWGVYSAVLVGLIVAKAIDTPPTDVLDWVGFVVMVIAFSSLCPIMALGKRHAAKQQAELEEFCKQQLEWLEEQREKYRKEKG